MYQQVQFTTAIQLNGLIFSLTLKEPVQHWSSMTCSNTLSFAGEGAIPYKFYDVDLQNLCAKEKYAASAAMLGRLGVPGKHFVLSPRLKEINEMIIMAEIVFPCRLHLKNTFQLLALPCILTSSREEGGSS